MRSEGEHHGANLALAIGHATVLVVVTTLSLPTAQTQFGTERDAKALLGGGFTDRDLYVFCANASDGVLTAHPNLKGEHLQDIVGKKAFPSGKRSCRTRLKDGSTR
jgi:hypothetical protein